METAGNNSPLDLLISQELKKHFKNLPSWSAWSTWLRVVYGLDLEEGDVDFFRQFTGLIIPRPGGYESIFTIVGRSGGKSTIAGLCAAWTLLMVPNGNVMVIAPRLKQTRPIVRAASDFLSAFKGSVKKENSELIEMKSGAVLEAVPKDYRTARGRHIQLLLLDEVAQMENEGALPVDELMVSLEPSLNHGAKTLGFSTAYTKSGFLWSDIYEKNWADDHGDILVWQAPTFIFNPSFSTKRIDKAVKSDPRFRAEYLSEFLDDTKLLLTQSQISAACTGKPASPLANVNYFSCVDVSLGGPCSTVLAICHRMWGKIWLDYLEEKKSVEVERNIDGILEGFGDALKDYHCHEVLADKAAKAFVLAAFQKKNIQVNFNSPSGSDLFAFLANRIIYNDDVVLLDNPTLKDQLAHLTTTVTKNGGHRVQPSSHRLGDVANAAAGAVWFAISSLEFRRPSEPVITRKPGLTIRDERKKVLLETAEDMELEFQKYLQETEGGVCLPTKVGREYVIIRHR